MVNIIHYGDNLVVLRKRIADETVDLIYLDPPFNSNANYNQLFRNPKGEKSQTQVEAFKDTWQWRDDIAGIAVREVKQSPYQEAAKMLDAMVSFLGKNEMTAYLAMMAVRLIELHRVLKPTGSLYLHCDPTASHYLKLLLDAVFGANRFANEIVWQRHVGGKEDAQQFPRSTDRILYYRKSEDFYFSPPRYRKHNEKTIKDWYNKSDKNGQYVSRPLVASSGSLGDSGQPWRGRPPSGHWIVPRLLIERYEKTTGLKLIGTVRQRLDILADAEFIDFSNTGNPSWRRYISEATLPRIQDNWTDEGVKSISRISKERLGYPTQKPMALLERIIEASSNPGDVVLDPFCGCGTTVHAAQKLGRQWIGVDVTILAVNLIEDRLHKAFGDELDFIVEGRPTDMDGARALFARDDPTKKEFEKFACGLIRAQPRDKKGADGGVDGVFWFGPKEEYRALVSVKGGKNASVAAVRELGEVVTQQEGAQIGVYLTLEPPTKAMSDWAAQSGLFEMEGFPSMPRLQIVTIAQALADGERAVIAPLRSKGVYKKAVREVKKSTQVGMDM